MKAKQQQSISVSSASLPSTFENLCRKSSLRLKVLTVGRRYWHAWSARKPFVSKAKRTSFAKDGEIYVTTRTIRIAQGLNNGNNGEKVHLYDINLADYSDDNDDRALAYYSAKCLRLDPKIGIPLLYRALKEQYDLQIVQ